MVNKDVLIFDLDGVLIDNTNNGFEKIRLVLKEIGLPPVSNEFLRAIWGKHMDDIASIVCRESGASSQQRAQFLELEEGTHVGGSFDKKLLKTIKALSQHGFLIGIITSRGRNDLENYSKKIGLDLKLFNFVQTPDDYPCKKPDGDVFLPLLKWVYSEQKKSENIIYFGDTVDYDLQAVKNFNSKGPNILFVGVCSGVNTYKDFQKSGLADEQIIIEHNDLTFYLSRLIQGKRETRKIIKN